jgi:uncharacterized protein YjbI with pentapeptide repeats
LSNWFIAAGTLVVLVVVAVIWWVLLRRYSGQRASVQLDAIRTGGTLVIGTGGAVALLLTARRQRYTELSLVHTDRDATERRITELYTKAADQLGSEQAPVRLAGLYALERLAHSAVEHRQSIVDVICAYLRMPYTPLQPSVNTLRRSSRTPGPRQRRARTLTDRSSYVTSASRGSRKEQAEQERQVRLTAQNILGRNLRLTAQRRQHWWHRKPPAAPAWPDIRLDLAGALLVEFSLRNCQLDYADFRRARFTGGADFGHTRFTGEANFGHAQFTGEANFGYVQFSSGADFERAEFTGFAYFGGAQFSSGASFEYVQFTGGACFEYVQFTGGADFVRAEFTDGANFVRAEFSSRACFENAQFTDEAYFMGARVASLAEPGSVWPWGWTTRSAKPEDGEDPAFLYLTKVDGEDPFWRALLHLTKVEEPPDA